MFQGTARIVFRSSVGYRIKDIRIFRALLNKRHAGDVYSREVACFK